MIYTATLFNCPVKDADKREAEAVFCAVLDAHFGGPEHTVKAYLAHQAAFDAHGELPLPASATDAEIIAVASWASAESEACREAFAQWYRFPDGSHFEIEVSE